MQFTRQLVDAAKFLASHKSFYSGHIINNLLPLRVNHQSNAYLKTYLSITRFIRASTFVVHDAKDKTNHPFT